MKTLKNRLWLQAGSLALAVAGLAALGGCGESGKAAPDKYPKNSDNAELFSIPQQQASHVQVVTVQPSTLARTLRLPGTVAFNSFRTTPVITQVSGPVSRVVVAPGQKVHRGQPMLYVASPDFSQLRTNYLKARDANDLAQKTYNRAKDLYDHHAIAVKDLEQAESAAVQAGGDLSAAEAALKVMGISDPEALPKPHPLLKFPCWRRSQAR
jgi:cobalt-zinc-cadmium efflux system membrane fusion protein